MHIHQIPNRRMRRALHHNITLIMKGGDLEDLTPGQRRFSYLADHQSARLCRYLRSLGWPISSWAGVPYTYPSPLPGPYRALFPNVVAVYAHERSYIRSRKVLKIPSPWSTKTLHHVIARNLTASR